MKLIFVEIILILAIASHTNSLAGRLHPTHTRTDTFSALKELIFGKFKNGGLTTFVKRLDGGPILYKTYQRKPKPQQEAGAEGQPGWKPNLNGNYDLLGIGWKKTGSNPNSESQAQAQAQPTGGLAGLANRLKTKKIEIQDHLKDKFEKKKRVQNNILAGLGARPRPGTGPGSEEMQLAPGSPEYERLKQYHLKGVVDMYRPPPTSAPAPAPGPGMGWGEEEVEAAPAPTANRNKMKAKKKKKDKKAKKKKQKKIKKKMQEEKAAAAAEAAAAAAASAAAKKKLKQQIKANKAAAAAGQGWKPPATILPAGSGSAPATALASASAAAASRIPVLSGGRNVVGSIGSTVSSTYKVNRKKSNKKGAKPKKKRQNQATPNTSVPAIERINSKLTRNPSRIDSSNRSEPEETLKSDSFSSRLGLAASSNEEGISYESIRVPQYSSYTAYYRVPNYRYSSF